MGETIKHANPDLYTENLTKALEDFEDALIARYKAELDDKHDVWTIHGMKPDTPTADPGPANTKDIVYNNAKESAPEWAGEVRSFVSPTIPEYRTQDLNLLESAFGSLGSAARDLGKDRDVGDDDGIPELTNDINADNDFATWAGPSGEAFKDNFGKSTGPTMDNQAEIATSLHNLYSGRICIIESVRRNTLNAFQRATENLGKTIDSGIETPKWIFINVAIIAVGVASAGVGTPLALAALAGGYLDSKNPDQEFANEIKDVANNLMDELTKAGSDANSEEDKFFNKIVDLQKDIAGVKSKELELYDFTGGDSSPGPPAGGFGVSIEDVYKFAKLCFDASKEYEKVITKAIETDDSDSELVGESNVETAGDAELKDIRDAFVSFLQTTCARYYEAGERLHSAARAYTGVETDNEAVLKALEQDPDLNGDRNGNGGSVDRHIDKTDRDDIEDKTPYEEPPPLPGGVEYGV